MAQKKINKKFPYWGTRTDSNWSSLSLGLLVVLSQFSFQSLGALFFHLVILPWSSFSLTSHSAKLITWPRPWYRAQLQALPEKSALQQRFSQEFLGGRVVGLHRFLNRLAEHPSLSTDPSLKLFLTAKPHVSHCGSIRQFLPGAKIMWINIIYFELHFLSFLFITHTLVIYILLVFFTRQNVAGGSPLNYARCHLKSRRKKSLSTGGAFLAATDRS